MPDFVLKQKIGSNAKLVYASLARYAGSDGRCYPSQDRIAEDLQMSRSVVSRAIKELESASLIFKDVPAGIDRLKHLNISYLFVWNDGFLDTIKNPNDFTDVHIWSPGRANLHTRTCKSAHPKSYNYSSKGNYSYSSNSSYKVSNYKSSNNKNAGAPTREMRDGDRALSKREWWLVKQCDQMVKDHIRDCKYTNRAPKDESEGLEGRLEEFLRRHEGVHLLEHVSSRADRFMDEKQKGGNYE